MTKSEIAISENANCAQNAKKRPNFATKGVYHLKNHLTFAEIQRASRAL